jgi:hypothetical protein
MSTTDKLGELLNSILDDDFDSYTEEYQDTCRQEVKSFLIGLISESDNLEQLRAKVEGL